MMTQSTETWRLFIAVDLPPAVRAVLRETQARLQHHRLPVRWVDPNGAHLTLKFLGAVRPDQLDEITTQMHQIAARHQPFVLQTGALGAFPDLKRARVVWLAINGDQAALGRLRDDVEYMIAPLGFPTEARAFSPHLTLGRTHKDVTPQDRATVGRVVAQQQPPDLLEFEVAEIVLFRSELGPRGARYTPLVRARLGEPPSGYLLGEERQEEQNND